MIDFKLLTKKDIEPLYTWLQLPHIREFWDDGDRTIEQVRLHYLQANHVRRYIIFIDGQMVGYSQAYVINSIHEYKKFFLPNESIIGIDYFIGNNHFLGRGFAIPILKKFIKCYCPAQRILVDPVSKNRKAIHIYKKFGFIKMGKYTINTQPHYIMIYNK